ncbi:cytochrome c55X [Cribrihabitans marinus]|uniref:Cytochrome c55X n=1 Tax=Cribrihabitans marinus TaxID=1227549 RepID=A0A1H7DT03_9RHOB|nr:cytochrome c [Cribrihabitans marinus]SEK02792.1 cytochrome c55X [Cribrihabitans marinus]
MAERRNRPPRRGWLLRALTVMVTSLAGAAFAADPEAPAPDAEALKRLVHQDCGSCHGLTLRGGLGPDLRAETLQHYDTEVLTGVILDGIPDTAMPPWRPLMNEAEAEWVARYLLTPEEDR